MRTSSQSPRFPWFGLDNLLKRFHDPSPAAPATPARLGLVLSCGGARGLAHIGVIQVLEEARIPISVIMGSSMGAYVGSLWAAGVPGEELARLAAEIRDRRTLLRLIDFSFPPTKGFLHGNKVRRLLERTLKEKTLGALDIPMHIVATNLDTVSGELFPQDTSVAAAVHASCAIPGIVSPVTLNGKRWIDGGAAQPLPVELLHRVADVDAVIAVNVMPTLADIDSCRLQTFPMPPPAPASLTSRIWSAISRNVNLFAYGNVMDTFKRCLTSAQLRLVADECARAEVVIHPYFCESKWYDFENFNRYIDAGRKAAAEALPHIQKLMEQKPPRPVEAPARHEPTPNIPEMDIITASVCSKS